MFMPRTASIAVAVNDCVVQLDSSGGDYAPFACQTGTGKRYRKRHLPAVSRQPPRFHT